MGLHSYAVCSLVVPPPRLVAVSGLCFGLYADMLGPASSHANALCATPRHAALPGAATKPTLDST